jgi:hypothetical protein
LTPEGIFFYAFLKNSVPRPLVQPFLQARAIWDSGAQIWDAGAKIWDMGTKMWDTGAVCLTTESACRCLEKFEESLERQ